MRNKSRIVIILMALAVLWSAASAFAVGPMWMPGFPMRMGPSVMLMWAPIPGATAYNLYKSDKAGDLGTKLISIPANNHMDMNVPMDKSAYYTVKAVLGGAESDPSKVGAIIGVKPLDSPVWAGGMYNAKTKALSIRWSLVKGASFYNVYKAAATDGPYSLMGSIQETKYIDATVEEGKTYYYQVSTVDKNNAESPKSAVMEQEVKKQKVIAVAKKWDFTPRVVKYDSTNWGPDESPFEGPGTSTVTPDGIMWFLDNEKIGALDLNNGEFFGHIQPPEGYTEQWGSPLYISYSLSTGNILTTWSKFRGIRIFDTAGELLTEWKATKPTKEEYEADQRPEDFQKYDHYKANPFGIAEDGEGNIWVTEAEFQQVHVFSSEGELLYKINPPKKTGEVIEFFGTVGPIAYHAGSNRMYLLDLSKGAVRPYDVATREPIKDEEGDPVFGWKRKGTGVGYGQMLTTIRAVENELWIVDRITGAVLIYDIDMNYLATLVTDPETKTLKKVTRPSDVLLYDEKIIVNVGDTRKVITFKP